ncbi:MAG: hypothetical protein RR316_00695 [Clostridia bacterium]
MTRVDAEKSYKVAQILKDLNCHKVVFCYATEQDLFLAQYTAGIVAESGTQVYMFIEPTTEVLLSFAIMKMQCDNGVLFDNCYKIIDNKGFTLQELSICDKDKYNKAETLYWKNVTENKISLVDYSIYTEYVSITKDLMIEKPLPLKIVYSANNGAGFRIIPHLLTNVGYNDITLCNNEAFPSGKKEDFLQSTQNALETGEKDNADIVIITDSSCSRLCVAIKDEEKMKLLTNQELSNLLVDYICASYIRQRLMPYIPMLFIDKGNNQSMEILQKYSIKGVESENIAEKLCNFEKSRNIGGFMFACDGNYGFYANRKIKVRDAAAASIVACAAVATKLAKKSL